MRKYLISLAIYMIATSANAGPNDPTWNPPARFDHPYKGNLTIKRLPTIRVQIVCERYKNSSDSLMRGCASYDSKSCIIIVVDHPFLGQTPKAIIRHERGHCNGWPADHPN